MWHTKTDVFLSRQMIYGPKYQRSTIIHIMKIMPNKTKSSASIFRLKTLYI